MQKIEGKRVEFKAPEDLFEKIELVRSLEKSRRSQAIRSVIEFGIDSYIKKLRNEKQLTLV